MSDHWIESKIVTGKCTTSDIDALISESLEKAIKDRINSRTVVSAPETNHKDNATGHNALSTGGIAVGRRILPSRKPIHKMSHGRSKHAHDKSTKTQRENAAKARGESMGSRRIKMPIGCAIESIKAIRKTGNMRLLHEMAQEEPIAKILRELAVSENDNYYLKAVFGNEHFGD